MAEEFEVSIEIHDGTTATILGDLHNHAGGLSVGVPVDEGDDVMVEITTDSPFVLGDFVVTSKPGVERLEVALTTTGATWPAMMTNYRTARAWWRQAGNFYVDVTLKGETTRYLARRPNVTSEPVRPIHLANNWRKWLLSFPVQPNPVVI